MEEKLWSRDFINVSVTTFLMACSFFLLMPTIPIYLAEELKVPHAQIGLVLSSYAFALLIIKYHLAVFSGYIFPQAVVFIGFWCFFVVMFIGYYFVVTVLFL